MKFDLENLPKDLLKDNAIRLEIEQGVLIFRATEKIQNRIAELIEKEKNSSLTAKEIEELDGYEEIDDYLSYVNRLIRNSTELVESFAKFFRFDLNLDFPILRL